MKKRILRRGVAFFCALLLTAASFCEGVYAADEVTAVSSSGDYQIGADTADSEPVEELAETEAIASADESPPGTVEASPERALSAGGTSLPSGGGVGEADGEVSASTEPAGETVSAPAGGEVSSAGESVAESVEEPVEEPAEEANESYTGDPTTGSAGPPPLSGEASSAEGDGKASVEAEAEEAVETEDEIGVIEDEETEESEVDEENEAFDEPASEDASEDADLFDEVFAATAASGLIIEGEVCEEESWEGGCVPHLTVNGSPGFCILPWSNIPDCDASFSEYEIPDEKDYINLMAKIMYFGCGGEGDILDDWNDGAYSGNEVAKEAITYYALCYAWIAQGGQGKDSENSRWYGSDDGGDLSEEGQKIVLSFVETVRNMTPDGTLTVTLESDTGEALSGATFGVYASEENAGNDSDPVAMLTTDVSGAASVSISSGTYYVRQLSAPDGYEVNAKIETGEVAGGEVSGTLYIAELCDQDRICQEAACAALSSSDELPLVLNITNSETANEYLTHESAPASILSALDPSYIEYGDDTLGYGEIGNIELKRTYIREGYPSTIEGFFADDDNMSGFLTSVSSEIAIYDVNTDSDYVVGVLNAENEGFLEVDFARRNDSGQVLYGEHYDYATGLVYILKEDLIYIDEAEKIVYLNYVQAQALIQCSAAAATAALMDYVGDGSIADLGDEGLSLVSMPSNASPSTWFDAISGFVEPGDYVDFVIDVRNGTAGQTMMDLFALNHSGGSYYYHCLMDGDISGADDFWNNYTYAPYSGNSSGNTPPYADYYFEASTIRSVTSNNLALSAWVNSLKDSGISVQLDCVHISTDNLYGTNANGMANVDVRMYVVETGTYGDNGHYAVISFCNVVNKAYPGWAGDGYQTVAATYVVWYEPNGELKLKKSSSDTDLTDGNSLYSLAGAKYGVYTDSSCKTLAKDSAGDNAYLTTDANGNSNTLTLAAGTYYVKEISTPEGYKLDENVYTVTISGSGTTTLEVFDEPEQFFGYLTLKKSSSAPDVTDGNSQYSLIGAKYGVYTSPSCDTLAKDADGNDAWLTTAKTNGESNTLTLEAGTYYVKEISAPNKGYELDTTVYTVTVTASETCTVNDDTGGVVYDTPFLAPISILLQKLDAETGETPQSGGSFAGAEYTVKYYDSTAVSPSSTAVRTWVFETDENGYVIYDSDHLVSGDALYQDSGGDYCLPMGTIIIEETKAPDGYMINSTKYTVHFTYDESLKRVVPDVDYITDANEAISLELKSEEERVRGGVKIQKRDYETGLDTPRDGATFEGAEFTLYNNGDFSVFVDADGDGEVEEYAPEEAITVLVTDESGHAETDSHFLPYGHYKIVETYAPEGYIVQGKTELTFGITTNGMVDLTGTIAIYDEPTPDKPDKEYTDAEMSENTVVHVGDVIGYTLTWMTEKDAMIELRDTLSVGLTYVEGSVRSSVRGLDFEDVTVNDDGTTTLIWNLGEQASGSGWITYSAIVNEDAVTVEVVNNDYYLTVGNNPEVYIKRLRNPVEPNLGGVRGVKVDAETKGSEQGDATLEGAVIAIVYNGSEGSSVIVDGETYNPGETVLTVTTDEYGAWTTEADALPFGTYYAVETEPSPGYLLNEDWRVDFEIASDEIVDMSSQTLKESVIRGGVKGVKVDAERISPAQGDATLEGAEITIYNNSGSSVIVNGKTYVADAAVLTVTTDKNGAWTTSSDALPYGTYYAQETKASTGYLLNSDWRVDFEIREDGEIVDIEDSDPLEETPIRGGVKGVKVDAERDESTPQGDATLKGAVIAIVYNGSKGSFVVVDGETYNPGETVLTVTTDENGAWTTSSDALPFGTYYAVETKAPAGYILNTDWRVDFEIREDGVIVDTSSETLDEDVIRGGVRIQKRDNETGYDIPEGAATFEGAEFTLYNESEHDVLVDTDGDGVLETYAPGAVITVLATNENGVAETASDFLPYGSYKVIETKAPEGYLKEGVLEQAFEIREDGVIVDMTAVDDSIIDEVKRGDVEFIKVGESGDSSNMERFANVPFRITSLTTGESHMIVTDINGYASTESSWNKHSHNTNAGETSEDGVWFCGYPDGIEGAPVDDSLGALPYDTYLIEELACEANEGYTLVRVQFTVYKDSVTVDVGTLIDQREDVGPEVTTELTNGRQKANSGYEAHFAAASDDAYIIEEVTLINVNIGEEYTLKVVLMDGETGEAYTNAAGETYVIEKTVVPIASIETVKVEFDGIDCSDLAGKSLVAYAYLYDKDGNLAASEELLDEEDETVYFPEITTEAVVSETGLHVSYAEGIVTITDTVSYGNVEYRGSFLLVGVLYDAETGEKLPDEDGNPVTSRVTFDAKTRDDAMRHTAFGTAELTFSIDASRLAGRTIVACEYLYDYQSMTLMAIENDLSNKEQSVYFVPVPAKEYTDENMYEGLIVDVGDEIGYTLTWSNKTQSSQYFKLKDTLSAGLTYKDGSASVEPESVTVNDDGTTTIVWNLGLKDSAAYGTISYVATVNETAKTEAEDYSVNNRYELSVSNDPDTDAYEFIGELENPLEPPEETEELPEITPEPQDITPEPKSNEPGTHTSPLTGDGSNTAGWLACFAAAVCALIAAVIIRSREEYSPEYAGERLRNAAFCTGLYRFICKGGIMRRERKWKKRQKRRSRPEKAINR